MNAAKASPGNVEQDEAPGKAGGLEFGRFRSAAARPPVQRHPGLLIAHCSLLIGNWALEIGFRELVGVRRV